MSAEKKILLDKIDKLINIRTFDLLKDFPVVHEINDGIIIRFFNGWDKFKNHDSIKVINISNHDSLDEKTLLFYLPKGVFFDLKKKEYHSTLTCLTGEVSLKLNDDFKHVNEYNKVSLDSDIIQGLAIENSYVITTNMI